jgi:hypothetical protein
MFPVGIVVWMSEVAFCRSGASPKMNRRVRYGCSRWIHDTSLDLAGDLRMEREAAQNHGAQHQTSESEAGHAIS